LPQGAQAGTLFGNLVRSLEAPLNDEDYAKGCVQAAYYLSDDATWKTARDKFISIERLGETGERQRLFSQFAQELRADPAFQRLHQRLLHPTPALLDQLSGPRGEPQALDAARQRPIAVQWAMAYIDLRIQKRPLPNKDVLISRLNGIAPATPIPQIHHFYWMLVKDGLAALAKGGAAGLPAGALPLLQDIVDYLSFDFEPSSKLKGGLAIVFGHADPEELKRIADKAGRLFTAQSPDRLYVSGKPEEVREIKRILTEAYSVPEDRIISDEAGFFVGLSVENASRWASSLPEPPQVYLVHAPLAIRVTVQQYLKKFMPGKVIPTYALAAHAIRLEAASAASAATAKTAIEELGKLINNANAGFFDPPGGLMSLLEDVRIRLPRKESAMTHFYRLVLVSGHGIYTGQQAPDALRDDGWLGIYPGEGPKYVEHIQKAVESAAHDPGALLMFTGGYTRSGAEKSEAAGYLDIARQHGWWGHPEVAERVVLENHARDSMENILNSLFLFRATTGRFPQKTTLFKMLFQRDRHLYHAETLGLPAGAFEYIGDNDPAPADIDASYAGERRKLAQAKEDPFLRGQEWQAQRLARDINKSGNPYAPDDAAFEKAVSDIQAHYKNEKTPPANSILYILTHDWRWGAAGVLALEMPLLILGGAWLTPVYLLSVFSLFHVAAEEFEPLARPRTGAERLVSFLKHFALALPYAAIETPGLTDAATIFAVAWHLAYDFFAITRHQQQLAFAKQDVLLLRRLNKNTEDNLIPEIEQLNLDNLDGRLALVRRTASRLKAGGSYARAFAREFGNTSATGVLGQTLFFADPAWKNGLANVAFVRSEKDLDELALLLKGLDEVGEDAPLHILAVPAANDAGLDFSVQKLLARSRHGTYVPAEFDGDAILGLPLAARIDAWAAQRGAMAFTVSNNEGVEILDIGKMDLESIFRRALESLGRVRLLDIQNLIDIARAVAKYA
jgi:hypothetical protein